MGTSDTYDGQFLYFLFTFEYFFRSPRELIGGRAAGSLSHRWAPLLLPLEKRSPSDAGPEPPLLPPTLVPVFLSMFRPGTRLMTAVVIEVQDLALLQQKQPQQQ